MFGQTVKFAAKKHSPEILLGLGLAGMVGSTVLACRATLKVEDILDDYQANKDQIADGMELHAAGEIEYPMEVAKKDMQITKAKTAGQLIKIYAPSTTLMLVSMGCILGSYRIMSKRNVALMAAYKVMEEAFTTYRGRVVKELGEVKDAHFMYGTDTVIEDGVEIDENGKKHKTQTEREELIPGAKLSGFARMFEDERPDQLGGWSGSTAFSPVHDYNLSFLEGKRRYFNDKLVRMGFVTVNDVYEELGFAATEAGMITGWRYKPENGDGYITFEPRGIDGNWTMGTDGDSIVLDFNIDGVIFDQNVARKELK